MTFCYYNFFVELYTEYILSYIYREQAGTEFVIQLCKLICNPKWVDKTVIIPNLNQTLHHYPLLEFRAAMRPLLKALRAAGSPYLYLFPLYYFFSLSPYTITIIIGHLHFLLLSTLLLLCASVTSFRIFSLCTVSHTHTH